MDRGFFLSLQAIRRQLAAMPHEVYLIRLIHHSTRRPFPGERLWTATELSSSRTVAFLRLRNREGCDVYLQPCAGLCNAGYILLDLDRARPKTIPTMRANGHEPCVVLQTSPGHLQAWVRVSSSPLEPALATEVAQQLARLYDGDLASADWRHLGRLAGFTNQKPARRQPSGYAPWVKVLEAQLRLASQGTSLLKVAERRLWQACPRADRVCAAPHRTDGPSGSASVTSDAATDLYSGWLHRLRIPQRFPQPDWSIADLWIAKELLWRGTPANQVQALLRLGSPRFPRCHADPEDYLRRTLRRAVLELQQASLSPRPSVAGPVDSPRAAGADGA